jgi:hypothetical protein
MMHSGPWLGDTPCVVALDGNLFACDRALTLLRLDNLLP